MKVETMIIPKWCSALVLGLAFMTGCSASGGDDDGEDGGEVEASMQAIYRVPVADAGLEPWAAYPVDAVEVKHRDGVLKIEYIFPTWLVGDAQQVELEGAYPGGDGSFPVSAGLMGSGECTVKGPSFVCSEHLPGVAVNPGKAKASMHAAGLSAHEVGKRMLVTEAFSVDPIGIIEFEMP